MKAETADYLVKARSTLPDAQKIAALPLPHVAAREAYLAAFHAAEAYIFEQSGKVAKRRRGVRSKVKLTLELGALPELLDGLGVRIVAIDERHALAPVEPEPMTRDPFDRMLLAQCQVEGLRLLTIDRALVSHPLAARG
jgi:PIN domain nuclease of toxin-antitoxin system